MVRRFRLNPCDYMFFSHDRMMQSLGQVGNLPMMEMQLEGDIDPDRLRRALRRAIEVHPTMRAGARYALFDGRPRWIVRDEHGHIAENAFTFFDWRDRADWPACADALRQERYQVPGDLMNGPQARLDYCAGPNGCGRVFLRWPHALMDAEGAQWFLAEIARLDANPSDPLPIALRPDGENIDVLAGRSLWQRFQLFRRALHSRGDRGNVSRMGLCRSAPADAIEASVRLRSFEPEETARIEANAKTLCPPGPGMYSRYLAGCTIRALHQLYTARGFDMDAYLVTLPMSVRQPGPRPVNGNYLIAATLVGSRSLADDRRALAVDLHDQLRRFHEQDLAAANWALMAAAGLMRGWQYRILLKLPIGLEPYASGFSFYGEIDPPIRTFLGATVQNLWGTGPLSAPPGWNPVFCRFGNRLNVALTWLRGCIDDELAEEYLLKIEREALQV